MEIWKDIPGHEGRYQVSDQGRVRSYQLSKEPKIRPPSDNGRGYLCIPLYDNRSVRNYLVHRLVAEAFCPGPVLPEVNHKNGDRKDNRAENLEWVTRQQNVDHAKTVLGRTPDNRNKVVATNPNGDEFSFAGQREAEIALRGKQTGRVSQAIKSGRPAYGLTWRLA